MEADVRDELQLVLSQLPDENLRALLEVLRGLGNDRPVRRWSQAIGSLTGSEADELRRIIQEGCGNVEPDAW
jgi:hypothetical protein